MTLFNTIGDTTLGPEVGVKNQDPGEPDTSTGSLPPATASISIPIQGENGRFRQWTLFWKRPSFWEWSFLGLGALGWSAYNQSVRDYGWASLINDSVWFWEALGGSLVLLGVPVLVSLLVGKGYRRSVRGSGLILMCLLTYIGTDTPHRDFISEGEATRKEQRNKMLQELDTQGYYVPDGKELGEQLASLKAKSEGLSGAPKRYVGAVLALQEEILGIGQEYWEATLLYGSSIGEPPFSGFVTLADIEKSAELLANAEALNQSTLTYLYSYESRLRDKISEGRLFNGDELSKIVSATVKRVEIDLAIRSLLLDKQVFSAQRSYLAIFRREWGHWSLVNGRVAMERPAALWEIKVLNSRLRELEGEQVQVMRQSVE